MNTKKPTIIRGRDPKINNLSNFWSLNNFKKSSLKWNSIANSDPRWRETSVKRDFISKFCTSDIKYKWADELTGINSDIPCIADKIIISKNSAIINYLTKLIRGKLKQ